jgi:hypothetical protein
VRHRGARSWGPCLVDAKVIVECWHVRLCLTCGHVSCCDCSPHRHARKHFQATGYPIIQSFKPGEDWRWCYVHEAPVRGEKELLPRLVAALAWAFKFDLTLTRQDPSRSGYRTHSACAKPRQPIHP